MNFQSAAARETWRKSSLSGIKSNGNGEIDRRVIWRGRIEGERSHTNCAVDVHEHTDLRYGSVAQGWGPAVVRVVIILGVKTSLKLTFRPIC